MKLGGMKRGGGVMAWSQPPTVASETEGFLSGLVQKALIHGGRIEGESEFTESGISVGRILWHGTLPCPVVIFLGRRWLSSFL